MVALFLLDAAFALALWGMAWLNARASATTVRWTVALIVSWLLTEPLTYFWLPHFEAFVVFTDVALGLAVGADFCMGRKRPLWLVGLLVSYIAQLLVHADDGPDKAMLLNVAFAVQILLVSSERVCQRLGVCLEPYIRPLLYSHGAASHYDRRFTHWLGGPPHRSAALRRASERANAQGQF